MAEITNNNGGVRGKKIRSKKCTTRLDMTPMVDLAFLLLTFFMLANTLAKPFVMEVAMPESDTEEVAPVNYKNILSLTLAGENRIFYSDGLGLEPKVTNYSPNGIRKILAENARKNSKLYVLVKPTERAKYHNIVDIFDELELLEISHYALVEPTRTDLAAVKSYNK